MDFRRLDDLKNIFYDNHKDFFPISDNIFASNLNLEELIQNFFELLCLSILEGEFIFDEYDKQFNSLIILFQNFILQVENQYQVKNNEIQENLENEQKFSMDILNHKNLLIEAINIFIYNLKIVKDLYFQINIIKNLRENEPIELLFNINEERIKKNVSPNQNTSFDQDLINKTNKYNRILLFCIEFTLFEANLSISKEFINKFYIHAIWFKLQDIQNFDPFIINLIEEKVNYSKNKIQYTLQKQSKNYFYYYHSDNPTLINFLEEKNLLNFLDKYWQEAKLFAEDKSKSEKYKRTRFLENLASENSLLKIYLQTSIGKSDHQDLSELEQLKSILINIFKPTKESFDDFAIEITENFINNNILSVKIDNFLSQTKDKQIDEILNFIINEEKIIKQFQISSRIFNYYPYRKIVFFLSTIIDEIISTKQIANLKKLLENFDSYLDKFDNHLKWCKSYSFNPRQLYSNECIFKFDNRYPISNPLILKNYYDSKYFKSFQSEVKLFFKTSYFKPEIYDDLEKDVDELKQKSIEYKLKILQNEAILNIDSIKKEIDDSIKNVRKDMNSLNEVALENQNKYKKDIEKSFFDFKDSTKTIFKQISEEYSKNSIQILAIFSAIVMFVSSSVNLFKEISSFNQALLFLLTFSLSISSFIVLLNYLVYGDFENRKKNIFVICLYILTIILIIVFGITTYSIKLNFKFFD